MIIYKTTNLVNDKIYIGQSTINDSNYFGSGVYLNKAIKKYGKENFVKEVVAYCDTTDKLNFLEIFYIKFFNSKTPNGYNLTNGGEDNPMNYKEFRDKVSNSLTGRVFTEEWKRNMRIPKKNKENMGKYIRTEEMKKNMSEVKIKQWQDSDSIYNTKEYRERKRRAKTQEEKEHQRLVMTRKKYPQRKKSGDKNRHIRKPKPEPTLCECGCGELAKSGSKFISGHNRRGATDSVETRKKRSISLKDKPKSKEHKEKIKLIRKNKTWEEIFGVEKAAELRKSARIKGKNK